MVSNKIKNNLCEILTRNDKERITILTVFFLIMLVKFIESSFYTNESIVRLLFKVLLLLAWFTLSYFVLRGNKIITYIVGIVMFISGLSGLIVGSALISQAQYWTKYSFILLGSFFCYGGAKLLLGKNKRNDGVRS